MFILSTFFHLLLLVASFVIVQQTNCGLLFLQFFCVYCNLIEWFGSLQGEFFADWIKQPNIITKRSLFVTGNIWLKKRFNGDFISQWVRLKRKLKSDWTHYRPNIKNLFWLVKPTHLHWRYPHSLKKPFNFQLNYHQLLPLSAYSDIFLIFNKLFLIFNLFLDIIFSLHVNFFTLSTFLLRRLFPWIDSNTSARHSFWSFS